MRECFLRSVCMSTTYVHFTLVNHIEVVTFIAWRAEKRRNRSLRESRKKAEKEPGAKMKAFSSYYDHLLLKFSKVDF